MYITSDQNSELSREGRGGGGRANKKDKFGIKLRTIRVLRLLRVGRLVISVPELYILLSGLTTSFKPILFGSIMLVSVILVWSIIVVELIHPLNSQSLGLEVLVIQS